MRGVLMMLDFVVMFGIFFIMIIIVLLVLYFIGLWKLFQKAGKNGWEAIVPFYNTWVLVEISGLAWWYALIIMLSSVTTVMDMDGIDSLLSIAAFIANFFTCYNISKKLHKDTGFAILMTLFPFIMIPIIGLSSNYQFDDKVIVSENGPIQGTTNHSEGSSSSENNSEISSNQPNQTRFCSYCGTQIDTGSKYCGHCGKEIK